MCCVCELAPLTPLPLACSSLRLQTQVLESDAAETRAQAVWPRPVDELPKMSLDEFDDLARETKGDKIILRYGPPTRIMSA